MTMKRILHACAFLIACTLFATTPPMLFDFETGNLQGWSIIQGNFGKPVTDLKYEHNRPKVLYSKDGKYFVSTLENKRGYSDNQMGIIESPVIKLNAPTISLKVGGGAGKDVGVTLHSIDGKVLAKFNGKNSETMHPIQASFPQCVGKLVFF